MRLTVTRTDFVLISTLFFVIGWITAGIYYTRLPKDCPTIGQTKASVMIVNKDGSYHCNYVTNVGYLATYK